MHFLLFSIACPSVNANLDSDMRACVSNPGCYFDEDLFAYRNLVGQSVLPGVPVCHFVIRNKNFLKHASDEVQIGDTVSETQG